MHRACKLTLKFITAHKKQQIAALLEAYKAAVNFYIRLLWANCGGLDKQTLAQLTRTRLSERYKSAALKQALGIVKGTRKAEIASEIPASCPSFDGAATLDAKLVSIEKGRGVFDIVIKLSTLHSRHPIYLPTKATAVLRKWLTKPSVKLIQGCGLSEKALILWVDVPKQSVRIGKTLGIDIGINKLITDSDSNQYGTEFRAIRNKIVRRKPGSNRRKQACQERTNFINRIVNQLPWKDIACIGVEDLKNLKTGKKKNRGKQFRKAVAPWTYRQVTTRIEQKAQEYRVRLVRVNPQNTSRTCPACSTVDKRSRKGESFQCVACNYKQDADVVGALNVLARTLLALGSVESPRLLKAMQ